MKKISTFLKREIDMGKVKITYGSIIILLVVLVLVLIALISPKVYYVSTGRYNKGSEEDNKNVLNALGDVDTESRFLTYFHWYNVIHELGHGMIRYNGKVKISEALEEQLVNEFAVAYWKEYGEPEKLDLLKDIVDYATEHIEGLDKNENYMSYAEKHWGEKKFMTFNGYGWFQFNSTKKAIENDKSLEEVLKEMGVKNFKLTSDKKLEYEVINEDVSNKILNDAVENFRDWGLYYPDVLQVLSDNPNNNYSGPYILYFNLIPLPDIATNIKYEIVN